METTESLASTDMPTAPLPDIKVSARQVFGIDTDMDVPAFSESTIHVPELDDSYRFDHDTTLAFIAGFAFNCRVLVQGYHGTGKSTHIEQVGARLNWPWIRINLNRHIRLIAVLPSLIPCRSEEHTSELQSLIPTS